MADTSVTKVDGERAQRPHLAEAEHEENERVGRISSLSHQEAEETHEDQTSDGGVDVRGGPPRQNQANPDDG